jgi:hypothetical protein
MAMRFAWNNSMLSFVRGVSPKHYPVTIKSKITVDSRDFAQVGHNLRVAGSLVTQKSVRALAILAIDLLRQAQPTVPIASDVKGRLLPHAGQLRESGRASVLYRGGKEAVDVGTGRKDGGVNVDLSKLRAATGAIKTAHTVEARVSYYRVNKEGDDIALWAHEDLLPAVPRPGGKKPEALRGYYVARREHSGPKWLEGAWLKNKGYYLSYLTRSINNQILAHDLRKIAKYVDVKGLGKGRVPRVKLEYHDIETILNGMSI